METELTEQQTNMIQLLKRLQFTVDETCAIVSALDTPEKLSMLEQWIMSTLDGTHQMAKRQFHSDLIGEVIRIVKED